ncbi:MAG: flagellar brake protein [Methylobacter sp.]
MCNANNDFTLVNQEDIRKKLNHLFGKNALLAIKVPGKFTASTLLTTITRIEGDHVFLGGFQNEQFNKDLLSQSSLVATANFEGIAVSFTLRDLSRHDIDDTFNLRTRLPESIEWVQRRNNRRVKVPINIPVKIQYKNHDEYFNVADISVAGLSYINPTEEHYFATIGEQHADCNIILPDKSIHLACFEIVNNIPLPYQHTKQLYRIGCEIKRPSYRLDTALQHLINKIDFHYQ